MYSILIVDFSVYRDSLIKVFQEQGYRVDHCESAYDAMKKLKAHEFDLVVSEVELPGDNAFDLYNYIRSNYPYIPTIMTTEKSIDTFFDKIFYEGIGNVLCKPIRKDVILSLAEKLITKENIFGLANYIPDIIEMKKVRINSSKQIQKAIYAILDQIEGWGLILNNKMSLCLVLNEMTINAVYHSHGYTKEKEARKPVTLDEGEYVDIYFAYSNTNYGFAIDDYNGKLSKERILESINKVILQEQILAQATETGMDVSNLIAETGRGIDLARKLTGEYYFIMKKDVRTEIILLFEINPFADDLEQFSSLRIIEDN